MEEMDLAINAATTPAVKLWMNWMMIIFLLSLVFVWKHKAARYVIVSVLIAMPIAFVIFNQTKSVHLIGIAHIVAWGPLLFYLIKYVVMSDTFKLKSPYGIWMALLVGTIVVSLVFDVRDVTMVILGMK